MEIIGVCMVDIEGGCCQIQCLEPVSVRLLYSLVFLYLLYILLLNRWGYVLFKYIIQS